MKKTTWLWLIPLIPLLGLGIIFYQAVLRPEPPRNDTYEWVLVTNGFERPLYVTHAQDDRLFVVEQRGKIWLVTNGEKSETPFLDIESLVDDTDNESGLLGMVFDPNYAENGYFYVSYNGLDSWTSTFVRYQVSATDPDQANPDSAEIFLTIRQPYGNHNGGFIQFGPDGYLYIGMGDGGSHNDPHGNGQNLDVLLGKLLRIDVRELPYQIPADNPFIDSDTPEIWAYGLRNPWRWSFDRQTGDLFIGDVGQNSIEEIDFQPASSQGGENYGWRIFEGNTELHPDRSVDYDTLTPPIHDYDHAEIIPLVQSNVLKAAHCSVTGGYVYRGATLPNLVGQYVYGDYCSGTIWTLTRKGDNWVNEVFMNTDFTISSFGEDMNGELYLTSFADGGVWQLVKKAD